MRKLNDTVRFLMLLALLLPAGSVIRVWERTGEARVARRQLKDFPVQLGGWRQLGGDQRFDPATEKILNADDYLSRSFESGTQAASFYVGYYASQRSGATYHSPLNCLPGSGWSMSDGARITITPAGGGPAFEANRYLVSNGNQRGLMVYWYQGRGRVTASEYWGKIYSVLDSMRLNRSDGAMVRVMVPVLNSPADAEKVAVDFASQAASQLSDFVPN